MTKAIQKKEPTAALGEWRDMFSQAQSLIKSGFLPPQLKTPEQVVAVVAAGRELGIGPMQSIRNIDVIRQQVTIKPRLMLAMAYQKNLIENAKFVTDASKAVFQVKRRGMDWHTETFTLAKAKKLGLVNKDNWIKQPETMLLWRAISAGMNLIFPDVVCGMGTPDEAGAIVQADESDDLEGEVVSVGPPAIAEDHSAPEPDASPPPVSEYPPMEEMIPEIYDQLLKMNGGDEEKANDHLKKLTTYKAKSTGEEKWVEIKDLANIAQHKPEWVKGIYKKVKSAYGELFSGT